jgi:tRNA threonylcarbamoyl adenosine modification protein YeaZ
MRVLAFDCAGAQCAAALLDGSDIVAVRRIDVDRGHAQFLMPMLCDLLRDAELQFGDVDRFAVTTGPGSFTGIRVALAAAHGLALGTGKPIIGVTVFEVLAASAIQSGPVSQRLLVAIESRRTECFFQLCGPKGAPLGPPVMIAPEQVPAWAGSAPLTVIGDAAWRLASYYGQSVIERGAKDIDTTVLARLAAERPIGQPPSPFYIRPPDAAPAKSRLAS